MRPSIEWSNIEPKLVVLTTSRLPLDLSKWENWCCKESTQRVPKASECLRGRVFSCSTPHKVGAYY